MTEFRHLVLNRIEDLSQLEGSSADFPAAGYSLFKHGSSQWAAEFALRLARLIHEPPDTIASSAYRFLPTAANAVTEFLHTELTLQGAQCRLARIYRGSLTSGDFSAMSHEERIRVMQRNALSVDPLLITGKDVLVIDDIRVTGSHEASLRLLFEPLHPRRVTFAYIAAIERTLALKDPQVEDRINHASVKVLGDLSRLIESRGFILNARSCKFILAQRHQSEFGAFLEQLPHGLLSHFYTGAICDGYNHMDLYAPSFNALKREFDRRMTPFAH